MFWFVLFPIVVHVSHGPNGQKSKKIRSVFLVSCRKLKVDEDEECENHGLKETDEQFQKIERDRNDTTQHGGQPMGTMKEMPDIDHRRKHVLSREDITIKS